MDDARKLLERCALAAVVSSAALGVGCRGNRSEEPPVHLQQNMDFQEKGEAQERNEFFPDGRWMRMPPEGTVAQNHLQAEDDLYRGLNLDGSLVDGLPKGIELDEALLARGEERFNIYCSPCHGHTGHGNGPATRRGGGMAVQPANFHRKDYQPIPFGYIFHVITNGKGQMLPYATQVSVEDRWAIAAWVRVLQISHRAKPGDMPTDAGGDQ